MFHQLNMKSVFRFGSLAILLVLPFPASSNADLLVNGSFEAPPGYAQSSGYGLQGVMPPGWEITNYDPSAPGADLYSSDGSFGLLPSAWDNFLGVTAFDGLGWVAGAGVPYWESFAQQLQTPLTPGSDYKLEAYLHQAINASRNYPGAYEVFLNASNDSVGAVQVAMFTATTDNTQWEYHDASFTAPANADELPWIIFRPYDSPNPSYPGIDKLSLTEVPEPSSLFLLVLAVTLFLCRRRVIHTALD